MFYTRPRAEKKVEARLRRQGVEVLLPLRVVLRQWADRKQKVHEPLFPGYVFARVDERGRLAVLQDDGVLRSVAFGGQAVEVSDDEIAQLRALQAVPDRLEAIAADSFPRDAEVIVKSGPLKGLRGYVVGRLRPLYLVVEAPSIAHAVRVHVPTDWVMRAN